MNQICHFYAILQKTTSTITGFLSLNTIISFYKSIFEDLKI